jgi:sialic acid synthase SpsE
MHEDVHHEGEAPTAIERVETMRNARRTAAEHLQKAQEQQQRYYNKRHKPRSFRKGDLILLSAKNLRIKRPSKKLAAKFVGPFSVEEAIGTQAYRL